MRLAAGLVLVFVLSVSYLSAASGDLEDGLPGDSGVADDADTVDQDGQTASDDDGELSGGSITESSQTDDEVSDDDDDDDFDGEPGENGEENYNDEDIWLFQYDPVEVRLFVWLYMISRLMQIIIIDFD